MSTPSINAWPPISSSASGSFGSFIGEGGPRRAHGLSGLRGLGVAALEALDASGGVDELLLAREERVALAADLQAHLVVGRARLEGVTAGAHHGDHVQSGVDVFLHVSDPFLPGFC